MTGIRDLKAIWKKGTAAMTPFVGTIWATGFSEGRFADVRLGMQAAEVEFLLGKPLREGCGPSG